MVKARYSMTSLLLVMTLLLGSISFLPTAAAAAAITVKAEVNSASGDVVISGKISSGSGAAVTVRVLNPLGSTDFIDQGTSGQGGHYTFTYTLDRSVEGVYQVWAGGAGIETPVAAQFIYAAGTGSGNPGGGGAVIDRKGTTELHSDGTIEGQPFYDNAADRATLALDAEELRKAEELMAENESGDKVVLIRVKEIESAGSYSMEWPVSALSKGESSVSYKLETAVGSFTLPGHMLKSGSAAESGTIEFVIAFADSDALDEASQKSVGGRPVIEIYFKLNGEKMLWSNPGAPVMISIPYEPTAEETGNEQHLVVWHIDGAGTVTPVVNGRYDAESGSVVFTTTHFSHYAVAYVTKTFDDISHLTWARKQVEVLASKGVIHGTSAESFSPDRPITRADYMLLLVRTLGLSADTSKTERFSDVAPGAYYAEELTVARTLGIAQGFGDNGFRPEETITRQDMMVLTARALNKLGLLTKSSSTAVLEPFIDREAIADYAARHVASLVSDGLIEGSGAGRVNPNGKTTRAEAVVFLYRIYMMAGGSSL